jgi:hypothetical protein
MDILTISQVASYLQVCEKTVTCIKGGKILEDKKDIDCYLEKNKHI